MGEVIQFRPATRYGKHLDAQARIERELQLPLRRWIPSEKVSVSISKTRRPMPNQEQGFPLNGIAIVLGSILVYALVISHVVGLPHYSARANLMPSVLVQN
jgi:hypothetical protein